MSSKPKSAEEFAKTIAAMIVFNNTMYREVEKEIEARDRAQYLAGWQAGIEAAGNAAMKRRDCPAMECNWYCHCHAQDSIRALKPPAETKQEGR